MNAAGSASCGAFRRHPCRRPRTFWHCPKGSWTSQRLASLCWVRGACAAPSGGFRRAPAALCVVPREGVCHARAARKAAALGDAGRRGEAPPRPLHCRCSPCSAEAYRVGDETRRNHHIPHHDSPRQEPRAGDLGAARLWLWAASPPSYVSAPPAHPVAPRARRGNCRLARFRAKPSARCRARSRRPCFARLAHQASRTGPWSCWPIGDCSHV